MKAFIEADNALNLKKITTRKKMVKERQPLRGILASCTYNVSNWRTLVDRSMVKESYYLYTSYTSVLVYSDGHHHYTRYSNWCQHKLWYKSNQCRGMDMLPPLQLCHYYHWLYETYNGTTGDTLLIYYPHNQQCCGCQIHTHSWSCCTYDTSMVDRLSFHILDHQYCFCLPVVLVLNVRIVYTRLTSVPTSGTHLKPIKNKILDNSPTCKAIFLASSRLAKIVAKLVYAICLYATGRLSLALLTFCY